MPLVISYPATVAHGPRSAAAATAIRAVATQVRRQLPLAPDELSLTLPALMKACRAVEVNDRRLDVSWDVDLH